MRIHTKTVNKLYVYSGAAILVVGLIAIGLNIAVLSVYFRSTHGGYARTMSTQNVSELGGNVPQKPGDAPGLPPLQEYVHGMLTRIDGNTLVIAEVGGRERRITFSGKTMFRLDDGPAGMSEITASEVPVLNPVQIVLEDGSDTQASQVTIVKIHD